MIKSSSSISLRSQSLCLPPLFQLTEVEDQHCGAVRVTGIGILECCRADPGVGRIQKGEDSWGSGLIMEDPQTDCIKRKTILYADPSFWNPRSYPKCWSC